MRSFIVVSISLLLAGVVNGFGIGNTTNSISSDIFVLAYTWVPELCYGQLSFKGCQHPNAYWKDHFVIKGLWPKDSRRDGYPQFCEDSGVEEYDKNVAIKVGWDDLVKYWPNMERNEMDTDFQAVWEQEWNRHGKCSGLSQHDYFKAAIDLIKRFATPQNLIDAQFLEGVIEKDTLQTEIGGGGDAQQGAVFCDSIEYLAGANTCWQRGKDGMPTTQHNCPADVLIVGESCKAGVLSIMSL